MGFNWWWREPACRGFNMSEERPRLITGWYQLRQYYNLEGTAPFGSMKLEILFSISLFVISSRKKFKFQEAHLHVIGAWMRMLMFFMFLTFILILGFQDNLLKPLPLMMEIIHLSFFMLLNLFMFLMMIKFRLEMVSCNLRILNKMTSMKRIMNVFLIAKSLLSISKGIKLQF